MRSSSISCKHCPLLCRCWLVVDRQFPHILTKQRIRQGETKPMINLKRFMNPHIKIWKPVHYFGSQGSCGLDCSSGEQLEKKRALFRWDPRAADPIDASLIPCTSSLFSCLSSPGVGWGDGGAAARLLHLNRNRQKWLWWGVGKLLV